MKKARYLSVATCGLLVFASAAHADVDASGQEINPYIQTDPDGVPLSLDINRPKPPSQAQIDAFHREQAKAAADKDWLVRGYEEKLRAQAQAHPGDDNNLYYELSSNKDMAKLAGLPLIDTSTATTYHTGATASTPGSISLRTDAAPESTGKSLSHTYVFKPLISPFSQAGAGIHNYYASLPVAMPSSLITYPAQPSTVSKKDDTETPDIDTPGMIAAQKDGTGTDSPDLSLDMLPGESVEHARDHQDKLELPLPMDVDELHRQEVAHVAAPTDAKNSKTVTTPTTTQQPPVVPTEDPNAPIPVSQLPVVTPVRAPIANPYDILNR